MNVNYDYGKKTASQLIGDISLYSIEGTFDEVLERVQKEKETYQELFIDKPWKVTARYIDGEKTRLVQFDKVSLRVGQVAYESDRQELQVWGERKWNEEETAFIEKQQANQEAEKLKNEEVEFERLKKKFGKK